MQVTGGYIAGLEKKINEISKEPITMWESEISNHYFYNMKKSYFLITLLLFGIGIFVLIKLLIKMASLLYGTIILIEIFIIILLLKKSFDEREEIESYMKNIFLKHHDD